jgi:predicted kinase
MTEPTIYIFFGLIASGKSTLAALFAEKHKATSYNTDVVRKELAGLAANARRPDGMGQGIYTPEFTAKTYQALLEYAERDLEQGACSVVLDGSYSRYDDRRQVLELADRIQAGIVFILCTCADNEVKRRLDLRAQDPDAVSDGRWEIFVRQKEKFEFPDELRSNQLFQLDTEADPKQLISQLEAFLGNRT